jgi:hypothetical protein
VADVYGGNRRLDPMAAYFVAVAMLLAPRGKPWTRSSASWSNISLTWTLTTCAEKARGEDRKPNWPARILSRPGHNQRRRIRACRFNSIRSQERSQKGGFLCAITAVSPSEIGVLIGMYRARTQLTRLQSGMYSPCGCEESGSYEGRSDPI